MAEVCPVFDTITTKLIRNAYKKKKASRSTYQFI